mgnify:CR=1 FL=1
MVSDNRNESKKEQKEKQKADRRARRIIHRIKTGDRECTEEEAELINEYYLTHKDEREMMIEELKKNGFRNCPVNPREKEMAELGELAKRMEAAEKPADGTVWADGTKWAGYRFVSDGSRNVERLPDGGFVEVFDDDSDIDSDDDSDNDSDNNKDGCGCGCKCGFDSVTNPKHYTEGRKYEPIDVAEDWGLDKDAYLFNALKYISRAGRKRDALEDLKKARFYLDKMILMMESADKTKTSDRTKSGRRSGE